MKGYDKGERSQDFTFLCNYFVFKSHCNAFSVKMKGYDKGDRSQGFT